MKKRNFLLVNLNETKAKKLAQVISNETSRKILDLLADGDQTESEIAKALDIPLSTVHYNLKHLKDANLVDVEEFHYSEKGRVVDHYRLANKFVIIAPRDVKVSGIKRKLAKIFPVALLSFIATGAVLIYRRAPLMGSMNKAAETLTADAMVRSAPVAPVCEMPNVALWFLFGAVFALVIYAVLDFLLSRK